MIFLMKRSWCHQGPMHNFSSSSNTNSTSFAETVLCVKVLLTMIPNGITLHLLDQFFETAYCFQYPYFFNNFNKLELTCATLTMYQSGTERKKRKLPTFTSTEKINLRYLTAKNTTKCTIIFQSYCLHYFIHCPTV